MAFRYGYFDSDIVGVDDEGMPIFDRAETSDLFALLFSSLVSDGVLALPSTCLQVQAYGDGLKIEIQPGFGMVKGRFCYNEEVYYLSVETAPQRYNRIDRVIMRCNYLDRTVEIIIRSGEEAANPKPPELIRPATGDYYELCLAEIRLSAKQKIITQSNITDTRPNSALCGYITQLIDHLDTAVFFDQFNAFYSEFIDKSNASYEQFAQMAADAFKLFTDDISGYIATLKQDSMDAYNNFACDLNDFYTTLMQQGQISHDQFLNTITDYITELTEKGNTDLNELIQQLIIFKDTNETAFLEWFERIKGILGEDAAGKIQLEMNELLDKMKEFTQNIETDTEKTKKIIDDLEERVKKIEGGWNIDYKHDAILGLCYFNGAYMTQHHEQSKDPFVLGFAYMGNAYLTNTL